MFGITREKVEEICSGAVASLVKEHITNLERTFKNLSDALAKSYASAEMRLDSWNKDYRAKFDRISELEQQRIGMNEDLVKWQQTFEQQWAKYYADGEKQRQAYLADIEHVQGYRKISEKYMHDDLEIKKAILAALKSKPTKKAK